MLNPLRLLGERFSAAGRRARKLALGSTLVVALASCSVSMPLPGFVDNQPTGSIKPKPAHPFEPEDWKIIEPTLLKALRAEGNIEPLGWSNPDSGRRGRLAALSIRFQRAGAACRGFIATVAETEQTRALQAVACVKDGEEIEITDAAPWKGL